MSYVAYRQSKRRSVQDGARAWFERDRRVEYIDRIAAIPVADAMMAREVNASEVLNITSHENEVGGAENAEMVDFRRRIRKGES